MAAVRRMGTTVAQPGQENILCAYQHTMTLQTIDIHTHIHWVQRPVQVEGNAHANQLAKKGTKLRREKRDTSSSITYI
jgi:ribonuclease HI